MCDRCCLRMVVHTQEQGEKPAVLLGAGRAHSLVPAFQWPLRGVKKKLPDCQNPQGFCGVCFSLAACSTEGMNKRRREDLLFPHLGSEPCVCTADPGEERLTQVGGMFALKEERRPLQGISLGILACSCCEAGSSNLE